MKEIEEQNIFHSVREQKAKKNLRNQIDLKFHPRAEWVDLRAAS
jgi:hypothetical protein